MINISGIVPALHTETEDLLNHIGDIIKIQGSIYKIRKMSGFAFVLLRTNASLLQCIYSPEFSRFPPDFLIENMSVIIHGRLVKDMRSANGFEVHILELEILSCPVSQPPVAINGRGISASLDTLLDNRPVTLRNIKERSIFRLQAGICEGFRQFFRNNGYIEIHSPKIVAEGAEGGANIFELDYFGKKAYLTQSPQFYKQIMVGVMERVYEIGPVFRAEQHDTSRHINEYTSVDLEVGFIESFFDIMRLETKMLIEALSYLRENYRDEIELLKADIPEFKEIPALKFIDAKELISKTYSRDITDYEDFEPEEERLLCELIKSQTGSDFVFVTHYKASKRPFYALDSKTEPGCTESFDLLFRGMEITTGGQRIHDYNEQVTKMRARGMNIEAFSSYLMAHKHGLPPHGGLGLGLERFTAKLLGFQNIRYATLFPRDLTRLAP